MSVLVQRPQMPGIIVLPRHSSSPANHRNRPAQPQRHHNSQVAPAQVAVLSTTNKPSRRQRGQLQQPPSSSSASPSPQRSSPKNDKRRSHQPAQQVTDSPSPAIPSSVSIISSSSSATVSASQSPVLSSASSPVTNQTTPATTPPTSSPTLANSNPVNAFNTPSRKGGRQHQAPKSAPNTPTPANSLPVPANRRRARSPRPTQKLPGLNLEELMAAGDDDSFPNGTPAKKNNRKVKALVSEPATWQQAALLNPSHSSGALTPLVDTITAVAHPSMTGPPSPTRASPPRGSVFDIAFEHGLTHSSTMPNLATPNRRTGGLHTRAPSVPAYSTFPVAKPVDALFAGLTIDSAPVTPAVKVTGKTHTRGQSVSSSLPPSTSLHARMAAAAASSTPSRRERTLTGNAAATPAGYVKFAGASFQTAPDAMLMPRPGFSGMLGRRGSSHSGSSDEDSEEDERGVVDLSEEEETGVFAF